MTKWRIYKCARCGKKWEVLSLVAIKHFRCPNLCEDKKRSARTPRQSSEEFRCNR
jgi:DNA-directed RNA polymerase subunit RPC12/RpoP